jgi:hypothetical protein
MQGRVPVGKGTHADVSALGNNEGVGTVANRRPKHKHIVTDPGHIHSVQGTDISGGGANTPNTDPLSGATSFNTNSAVTNVTVGPQTGAEPTDTPAFLTHNFIIKT